MLNNKSILVPVHSVKNAQKSFLSDTNQSASSYSAVMSSSNLRWIKASKEIYMNTLSVKFELPTIVASQAGLNLENINQEVKLMFAMFLYEHKRISLSKACEIGGIDQWDFFEANRQLKIPIHYTQDDLKKDIERLSDV